jgi:hypothetical protein
VRKWQPCPAPLSSGAVGVLLGFCSPLPLPDVPAVLAPDVGNVSVVGLKGLQYWDNAAGGTATDAADAVTFDGEVRCPTRQGALRPPHSGLLLCTAMACAEDSLLERPGWLLPGTTTTHHIH